MTRPPLPLTVLFAMIVSTTACDSGILGEESSCPEDEPSTETSSQTRDIYVVQAEYEDALDEEGVLSADACMALCKAYWQDDVDSFSITDCTDVTVDAAEPMLSCEADVTRWLCEGRAHEAVGRQERVWGPTAEARWLARATHAEASSVGAFLTLARELEAHDAPQDLIDRARAAAMDEIAHGQTLGALAREAGGRCQPLVFGDTPERSLEALAIENAVEACVGETWSALVASWQAIHAPSEELRSTFSKIASDETRHAELARDLHAWAMDRLDADAQGRVHAAAEAAWDRLVAHLHGFDGPTSLGLPEPDQALALVGALRAAVA